MELDTIFDLALSHQRSSPDVNYFPEDEDLLVVVRGSDTAYKFIRRDGETIVYSGLETGVELVAPVGDVVNASVYVQYGQIAKSPEIFKLVNPD